MIQASPEVVQALSRAGACAVLGLNRGSGYRRAQGQAGRPRRGRPLVEDAALITATEATVLAHPGYGRPRVTVQLRREGWQVNPKRVQRLLREGGWLQVRKRRKVRTTQSDPGYARYPNSDRGAQYACQDYVQRLEAVGAQISMCAAGAPKENAVAERVIRTIKEEEVDLQEYRSFTEARREIGRFIEEVYNRKRLHSALGYRSPSEFEEWFAASLSH